ncbi:MAG: hypothetical protein ACM3JH_00495 [Acidithiobacillales bacterium]
MFGSSILDVAIGLTLVFLLTGVLCTAVMEAVSSFLALRSTTLEEGLRHLLDDPAGTGLAAELYKHVQISGLSGAGKPSYIPAENFARALLDILFPRSAGDLLPALDEARRMAAKMPKGRVQDFVLTLIGEAGNDVEKVRTRVETWFNAGMDRVGGLYKRKTQWIVLLVALLICLVANIDAVQIGNRLNSNSVLRSQLVAIAEKTVERQTGDVTKPAGVAASAADLKALDLNLGWTGESPGKEPVIWAFRKALGILIAALAASLGAPFWFDVLSKFINLRSAGLKPLRKPKPEEG